MVPKRISSTATLSQGMMAASASALFAASAVLFVGSTLITRAEHASPISIRLQPWKWLNDVKVDVYRLPTLPDMLPGLSSRDLPDTAKPVFKLARNVAKIGARVAVAKNIVQSARIARVEMPASREVAPPISDTLAHSVSAPQVSASADALASAAELEKFQALYRQIHVQFHLALQQPPKMNIQAVASQPNIELVKDQSLTSQAAARVVAPLPNIVPRASETRIAKVKKRIIHQLPSHAYAEHRTGEMTAKIELTTLQKAIKALTQERELRKASDDKIYKEIEELSVKLYGNQNQLLDPVGPGQVASVSQASTHAVTPLKAASSNAPIQAAPLAAQATPLMATQASSPAAITVTQPGGLDPEYASRVDYSKIDLQALRLALNSHAAPWPNYDEVESPTAPSTPTLSADADPGHINDARLPIQVSPGVVEAFEWKTPIEDALSEVLTLDGWKTLRSSDHVPTLIWRPDGKSDSKQAAMLSNNAALMLSKLADRAIQKDMGIIFGKVPVGWNVEFSGRSEKIIYLNETNQFAPDADSIRYFALLNAAPGAQVLSLRGSATFNTAVAAVATPVLGGLATYLDLTAVSKRTISGTVLEASDSSMSTSRGASVSVVGEPNAVAFSDANGLVQITEAYAVGDFPLFVDVQAGESYKHRYRLTPDRFDGVSFYRLSNAQVDTWLGQLEGGVSPQSGLVIAALKDLAAKHSSSMLYPSTHPVQAANLVPESYSLAGNGQFLAAQALDPTTGRFVSVQVPEGLVISQVEDANHKVIWSQLLVAQPGVVNIVAE